jgi:hypothetical protein
VIRPQYLPTWVGLAKVTGAKIVRPQKLMAECRECLLTPPAKGNTPQAKAGWVNSVKIFLSLHDDSQVIRIFETSPSGPNSFLFLPTHLPQCRMAQAAPPSRSGGLRITISSC